MKLRKVFVLCVVAAIGLACYRLSSTNTVSTTTRAWSGTNHASMGSAFARRAVGLAGQNIYTFTTSGADASWTSPALANFGGAHVLTSFAQTHALGFHEHAFMHGNLVGQTNNLDLLHKGTVDWSSWETVEPLQPELWEGGRWYDITQICDMTASTSPDFGNPNELDSHLYLSFRACPRDGSACAAGVLEVQVDTAPDLWWIRSNQEGFQVGMRKLDGSLYSSECMPIAVTAYGDQETQYLVVGDPSWDEISIYDADRLWEGPTDALRTPDTRVIKDVWVEGHGDGSVDTALVAALWKDASSAQLRHVAALNGELESAPHLTETVASDVLFIQGRGLGAQSGSGDLFTFGNQVVRRLYVED